MLLESRRKAGEYKSCPPSHEAGTMLSSFFLNPVMLLGLSAVLVPVIIHLLNRRRYEIVDWGAMQFLQLSEVTRRRMFLEEVLLMLLRMGLIAVLVLALAGPFVTTSSIARLGARTNRDIVLVFDGSYSMGSTGPDGAPHEKAKEWVRTFLADLTPGDSVAILQAKEQVVPVLAEPSRDPSLLRQHIDELPPPAGGCDWRPALQTASAILSRSQRAEREIILLSDGQRFGWADSDSLLRWSLLSSEFQILSSEKSRNSELRTQNSELRIWVVNVASQRPADLPNWSLTPLETNRLLATLSRPITFQTAIDLHGQKAYSPPHRVRLEVDGRFVRNLEVPSFAPPLHPPQNGGDGGGGRVPFSFSQAFAAPGSHLVSVILEPDPPPENRPKNYTVKDELPGDNRQDFAIEVVRELPVLIVDGNTRQNPTASGIDFLRQALEARDPAPVVRARVVSIKAFDPALLNSESQVLSAEKAQNSELRTQDSEKPRVLILRDVAQLTAAQQDAITQFLADGGGVLVTLGPRALADAYNDRLHRGGKGWLPATLEGIAQSTGETPAPSTASPVPGSSDHPALRLFLEKPKDGQGSNRFPQLGRVRFSRWWKLAVGPAARQSNGVQIASLRTAATESPFLVEWVDPNRAGRLLQCAVPLDDSWGGELVRSESFVPLVHELVYYLAGARSAELNLEPGQPLRYRLESVGDIEHYKLQTPLGRTMSLSTNPSDPDSILAAVDRLPAGPMLRIDGVHETGVYRLIAEDKTIYYVVHPNTAGESDLTPCTEEERAQVAKLVPGLRYMNNHEQIDQEWISEYHRQELWSWLLLGLIALLCGEVWLTRRIVKNRSVG